MPNTGMNNYYIKRTLSHKVAELNRFYPCILVTGARQVGKSTLLRHILPESMRYISLDDFLLADYARRDPAGFLESNPGPLCIDEVQYAPDLLRAIKMKVDADRQPGMYWLTGSQRFNMMAGVSETLAGRIGIIDMYSLSQNEMYGTGCTTIFNPAAPATGLCQESLCSLPMLYERILRGGYPEIQKQPQLPTYDFFRDYVQTYVERDVRQLTQITDEAAFMRMMRSAALRSGQQIVYSDLARDAGVSPKTAAAWVSILQASGLVELLEPYYVNTTKRLAKTPKLYFMDTGLCCWLAGWRDAATLMESNYAGAILETWVYGQLIRSYANVGRRPIISYYRAHEGAEVDFIIEENGGIYPMEVKRSGSPMEKDLRWSRNVPVAPWFKLQPPVLFCTIEELRSMPHGATAFPISGI
ncbi:MAG: ATP-binding protein [Akkermansia sp.]|nr:ATP-binding protein [Akkermansia sp.]